MNSMTGYGQGKAEENDKSFTVEIKTINHRFNDITVKMPKHISHFEDMIKRKIKESVRRGRVEAYITTEFMENDNVEISVNVNLAKSYKEASEKIAAELFLDDKLSLESIMKMPEVMKSTKRQEDDEELRGIIETALEKAISNLVEMRKAEGEKLLSDILEKLERLESIVSEIEQRAPEIILEYKEKLSIRITELLENQYELDQSKLANEVAYFADKSGIDEEIVRMKSHISQARNTATSEETVGKKLDFIVQEMNRETNTIGSKVGDIEITNKVVEMKTEIEKIREQIQNIE